MRTCRRGAPAAHVDPENSVPARYYPVAAAFSNDIWVERYLAPRGVPVLGKYCVIEDFAASPTISRRQHVVGFARQTCSAHAEYSPMGYTSSDLLIELSHNSQLGANHIIGVQTHVFQHRLVISRVSTQSHRSKIPIFDFAASGGQPLCQPLETPCGPDDRAAFSGCP